MSEAEEVEFDIQAEPVSRDRMDLLWLDPQTLSALKSVAESRKYSRVVGIGSGGGSGALYESAIKSVNDGKIGVDDLSWALDVDALAAQAQAVCQAGDYSRAISHYRMALRSAPGCDLYLMSIGSCYGHLDRDEVALRYMERAAEINPTNPRIARNLMAARSNLPDRRVLVSCPHCAQKLRLPSGRSGAVKCPNSSCGKTFHVTTEFDKKHPEQHVASPDPAGALAEFFRCDKCKHPFMQDNPLYPKNGRLIPIRGQNLKCANCASTIVEFGIFGRIVVGTIVGALAVTLWVAIAVAVVEAIVAVRFPREIFGVDSLAIVAMIGAMAGVAFMLRGRADRMRRLEQIAEQQSRSAPL